MGRTSRLRRRKYDWKYDRKTKALLVSKPLAKITTSSIIPPAVNTSFCQLQSNLPTYVSMGWVNVTPDLEDPPVITLCKPVCHPTTIAAVKCSVRIEEGCTWNVWLHDKPISQVDHPIIGTLPHILKICYH